MDARVEAEPMIVGVILPTVTVNVEKVDAPVIMLVSLFDAASALASLLDQGNSVTAVAPDLFHESEVSALAIAA